MSDPIDLAAEGLLDGLEGDARAQREELLRWLLDDGFTVEMVRTATSPMLLPAERVISGGRERISFNEVARRSDLDAETLDELRRAQGFPVPEDRDAPLFAASDADVARLARDFMDAGLDREHILLVSRVLGDGLAQTAEVMRQTVLAAVLAPGTTEVQLAQAYSGIVEQLAPRLGPLVDGMLTMHLRQVVETEAISAAELRAGQLPGAREVTIAFGDLVGFTRMGEQLDPATLSGVAARLAGLAREHVANPVRFIKTIGDAVMLVSPDPRALLDTMLALIDAAEAEGEEFPQVRVGLATGPAVSRAGDWFGHPVNLASRVTAVARPGTVLVDPATEDRLRDDADLTFSYAGERRLKGIRGQVKLYRPRPARAS